MLQQWRLTRDGQLTCCINLKYPPTQTPTALLKKYAILGMHKRGRTSCDVALDLDGRRLKWPTAFSGWSQMADSHLGWAQKANVGHLGLGSEVHHDLKWPTDLKV